MIIPNIIIPFRDSISSWKNPAVGRKTVINDNDNEKNFLINCVDFSYDSAITKQALMALTAPKVEKS